MNPGSSLKSKASGISSTPTCSFDAASLTGVRTQTRPPPSLTDLTHIGALLIIHGDTVINQASGRGEEEVSPIEKEEEERG